MAAEGLGARRSQVLRAALSGSWRVPADRFPGDAAELQQLTPLLIESGTSGLVWWRIRTSELRATPAGDMLYEPYLAVAAQNGLHEQEVLHAVERLRAVGIEPILLKGWSVARLYPRTWMRPCGDVDLWVMPECRVTAEREVEQLPSRFGIDLEHAEFPAMGEKSWDELYGRSILLRLNEADVRVLSPEDQLRHLCIHFMRHGAWRPLWLCDIAVALETRPAVFDWDVCLGPDRRRADWVACAIGLAYQVLGANVEGTPVAWRAEHLPSWLVPALLRQWDTLGGRYGGTAAPRIAEAIRHPTALARTLRAHWFDPIRATVWAGASFDETSRLPVQIRNYLWQLGEFMTRVTGHTR